MKCLFCNYNHSIAKEFDLNEELLNENGYAHDDYCDYGNYVEEW